MRDLKGFLMLQGKSLIMKNYVRSIPFSEKKDFYFEAEPITWVCVRRRSAHRV